MRAENSRRLGAGAGPWRFNSFALIASAPPMCASGRMESRWS